jgi:hypothetical protein
MNASTRFRFSYTTCRWLLIPVVALHNAEEWITEPHYGSISPTLQNHFSALLPPPSFRVLQIGWIIATLLPALVVFDAASAGHSRIRDWLVCWMTSIYLANAFLPHLLEFTITRSYAPGVVTAVFINIPFAIMLLRRAVVERYLTGRQLYTAVSAGVAGQPFVLVAVYGIAAALALL